MQILRELNFPKLITPPLALTIGVFDGVHIGHQAVFKRLKEKGATTACLTFENHPVEYFSKKPISLICGVEERLRRIEKEGVDIVFLLTFNQELGRQSAEEFLRNIKKVYPFQFLILGYDALFGKNREGTQDKVKSLQKILDFEVEYIPPVCDAQGPISSSRIRALLKEGKSEQVSKLCIYT